MKAFFKNKFNRDFEILIIWVEIKSNLIRIVEDRGKILQSDFSFVCVELGSYRERTVTERINVTKDNDMNDKNSVGNEIWGV